MSVLLKKLEWVDDFLTILFNLASKLGISPFYVANELTDRNNLTPSYKVNIKKWKKYLSGIISLTTGVIACIATSSTFSRANVGKLQVLFFIAADFGDTVICFMYWLVIWRKQNKIRIFYSHLSSGTTSKWHYQDKNSTEKITRSAQFKITFTCILIISIFVLFDMFKLATRTKVEPGKVFDGVISKLYYELQVGLGLTTTIEGNLPLKYLDPHEYFITLGYLTFICLFKIVKAFAVLLCLAGICTAFKEACELEQYLSHEQSSLKALHAFFQYQEFIEALNEVIGPLVFGLAIVCAPTFMVANMGTILISWNVNSPSNWLTMMAYTCILLIAAEVPNRVDSFREWIYEKAGSDEDSDTIDDKQLFSVFVNLTQNPVGVQGFECFTITYGFMAQMMSAVVTFVIIMIQFY